MKPSSREEAYELLIDGGQIIGGGAWLKLMPKTIENAIDISGLGLDQITTTDTSIRIGSMTTLRMIETNEIISGFMDGIVSDAASHIMGVTLRNIASIGGSVVNRFGFSDMLTPLLAIGASLHFYKHGIISLEGYLSNPFKDKDLLIEIILDKQVGKACYSSVKKTSTDFPVINVAVSQVDGIYRVAVGARPGVAKLAPKLMLQLNGADMLEEADIETMVAELNEDIVYGSNSRGSASYRSHIAQTLVKRCLKEVVR